MTGIDVNDRTYLERIRNHCERIEAAKVRFGFFFDAYDNDADYQDVICMNLFQIGEISNQISEAIKTNIDDIEWDKMYAMRNILAHAYLKIDNEILWDTIQKDIPKLKSRLDEII